MYTLIAIANPANDRLEVVKAEWLSPNLFRLLEDSVVTGYQKGDLVQTWEVAKNGRPQVQRKLEKEA